jgi:hypothetical protein
MLVNPSVSVPATTLSLLDRNNRIVITSLLGAPVTIEVTRQVICVNSSNQRVPQPATDAMYSVDKNIGAGDANDISAVSVVVGGVTYTGAQMAAIVEAFTDLYAKNKPVAGS